MPVHKKKRKFEMGRQMAMTKLAGGNTTKKTRMVRGRGGNYKIRALRLDHGNYSWGSESVTRKTRVLEVVYNATNNELVRTKTLVKNCIVQIDATPFKAWYLQHYGTELGKKKGEDVKAAEAPVKKSRHAAAKVKRRAAERFLDAHVADQFNSGRLLACIASRPGQSGRADGYILEGKELEFYVKKLEKKKK